MNRAYVIMDGFFTRTKGRPSSNHLGFTRFGCRYTAAFDHVTILTRIHDIEDPRAEPIEGPNLEVQALPAIHRLGPFILFLPKLLWILFQLPRDAVYILRVPGFITSVAWLVLLLRGIPFGAEIVEDPADTMAKDAAKIPLQSLFGWFFVTAMRWECRTARATAYVTAKALQKRYPPAKNRATFNYTSLDLRDEDFVSAPRSAESFNLEAPVLINVAMMKKMIKAQDVILQAFAQLRREGSKARLVLVGDGDYRPIFEKMAQDLGISEHVRFTGLISKGAPLWMELDKADLFLLPSRQEGLPRAMIEAMARGLPCIAADVGGSNELVPQEELVPKGDVQALLDMMRRQLKNPEHLAAQSARNIETARAYHIDVVSARRASFYNALSSEA